jgi:1,4-alpha-glucan branching enzyme
VCVLTWLALVLELHHPLPGPGDGVGPDWAPAALQSYWPMLRGLSRFAEAQTGASLTLAISPGWLALAAAPAARAAVSEELNRRESDERSRPDLLEFIVDRWDGDAVALVRHLGQSGAVDLIPTTSSHTWLPSVAGDPIVARAQISLAAADHTRRMGLRPSGIWLPFLSYLPGLESTIGEAGLRFFGAAGDSFLRGTVLPPDHLFAPLITLPGVAVFGVDPEPAIRVFDLSSGYGQDTRYRDPAGAVRAAARHAEDFLASWRQLPQQRHVDQDGAPEPISVVAFSAHDLMRGWPGGKGDVWLEQVLLRLPTVEGATAIALAGYLDRQPTGIVGRPGPSAGGFLSARPGRSDLFDRCRVAADLLAFAIEHREGFGVLERRSVAHMTRCLLRAQQVDWAFPPGHGIDADTGLRRASAHLDRFHTLASLLMAGRPDRRLLDELDRGPRYLPEIDLELLAPP